VVVVGDRALAHTQQLRAPWSGGCCASACRSRSRSSTPSSAPPPVHRRERIGNDVLGQPSLDANDAGRRHAEWQPMPIVVELFGGSDAGIDPPSSRCEVDRPRAALRGRPATENVSLLDV